MTLFYKFKKEELENGGFVSRPRILVTLHGKDSSIEVTALIDSGCDITVVPESLARALGLDMKGKKDNLFAFRESSKVTCSKVNITFLGKLKRQYVTLKNVPILITESKDGEEDEEGIVLGVQAIFDNFDIHFKKARNEIIMKKVGASA